MRPPVPDPAAAQWQPAPAAPDPTGQWQPAPAAPAGTKLGIGLLLGLVIGLVVFGGAGGGIGYYAASGSAPSPSASAGSPSVKPTSPGPRGTASLQPFDKSHMDYNKKKFAGDLANLAGPWLPWMSLCAKNGDKNGPTLRDGEDVRVVCGAGNLSVAFVQYKSSDARDKARGGYVADNVSAKSLAPGVGNATTRKTPSGVANGNYVEFAYKLSSGDNAGKVIAGVWWDDEKTSTAAYVLAYWVDDLGETWEPLRDVWQRTA